MIFDRPHFHFFPTREVSALNFMMALLHFGEGMISIFVPIYFWGLGFPLWQILLFSFFHSFFFVLLVIFSLPLLRRISDKMMMSVSIPFTALYFLGLNYVDIFPVLFYTLPLLHAFQLLLFNVGYHLDFSTSLDGEKIGKELGRRSVIISLASFPAPFIGGVLIAAFGFHFTFLTGVAVLLFAMVPLFFFPPHKLSSNLHPKPIFAFIKSRHLRPFNLSGFGYAIEAVVARVIWPLFIFFAIGSIEEFGGVITMGLLGSIVVAYLTGFLSDHGKRRKVLAGATGAYTLIWALRPFMNTTPLVVGNHVLGQLSSSALLVSWVSQYYKLSRAISDSSLFILSRELLYNMTRVVFVPILIVLAYFLTTEQFFTISFLLAAFFSLFFLFANRIHTSDVF